MPPKSCDHPKKWDGDWTTGAQGGCGEETSRRWQPWYAIHSGGSRVRGLMVHMADTHGYGGIWLHELRRLEQHGY